MKYLCPHCQKISYTPQGLDTSAGFTMICCHCEHSYHSQTHQSKEAGSDPCDIACPTCDNLMRVSSAEYALLTDVEMACPACHTALLVPDKLPDNMPDNMPVPDSSINGIFLSFGLLYIVILIALGLFYTPYGHEVMAELGHNEFGLDGIIADFYAVLSAIWHKCLAVSEKLLLWTRESL